MECRRRIVADCLGITFEKVILFLLLFLLLGVCELPRRLDLRIFMIDGVAIIPLVLLLEGRLLQAL